MSDTAYQCAGCQWVFLTRQSYELHICTAPVVPVPTAAGMFTAQRSIIETQQAELERLRCALDAKPQPAADGVACVTILRGTVLKIKRVEDANNGR